MFEVFSNTTQTLATNQPVIFNTTKFSDCRIKLDSAGSTISISTPGKYMISFDGIGGSSTNATPFGIQMYVNGVAQPCAQTANIVATAGTYEPLSFNVLIQVNSSCCCANNSQKIQFIQTAPIAGSMIHANVTVIRL